ncbi:MAG: hydrogenase expression/formation protein HypE [Thermoguttaceae bacterium]|nr:hydrogenase expression/formation protein HypE [Thermoguttaceae bacterium]
MNEPFPNLEQKSSPSGGPPTSQHLWTGICPLPFQNATSIQLAHGGGGRLMRELIRNLFVPIFSRREVAGLSDLVGKHDSAVLPLSGLRVAVTTDSYVVRPLFFPGGDIGRLAVFGTINDLAMAGAQPVALSAAFILEEGFPLSELLRIVLSMEQAAEEAGVVIVTGDTKVVDRGKGDGVFITTTGVGVVPAGVDIGPHRVRPGDAIMVSGDIGRHGVAILSVREGLAFHTEIQSDCAPLERAVRALISAGVEIHCLRDLTRGGLAAALNEIAADAGVGIELEESAIPVSEPVLAACELLGLDPLYVACEGRLVCFVPPQAADWARQILSSFPGGECAAQIGKCVRDHPGTVVARGPWGTERVVDLLSGEQMPRIC